MLASAARSERYEPSRRQVVRQKSGPVWSAVRLATVVGTSPMGPVPLDQSFGDGEPRGFDPVAGRGRAGPNSASAERLCDGL